MSSIILIRHGETDWNLIGRYQGQADPSLNAMGYQQARQLAEELLHSSIDIIYTSPLKRTRETAEIIAEKLKIQIIDEPRLMEIHQGEWQTKLRVEIEQLYPQLFAAWENTPWEVSPPGGESLPEVQSRVNNALDEILMKENSNKVGLVTHRIPIALIKVRFQGMDPDIVRTIHLPNAYFEEIEITIP